MSQTVAPAQPGSEAVYHVSRAGSSSDESLGPWTVVEIAARLAASEIAITDFIYDDGKQDWIPLLECEALKAQLRRAKPKAPPRTVTEPMPEKTEAVPVAAATAVGEAADWFVQKGTHRYGPYTYSSLVKALQTKQVYEFDLVWKAGMDGLMRIAEHPEFQREKIQALLQDRLSQAEPIFTKRAHPRLRYESDVIVNDGRSAWTGRTYEGSLGGSGLVIENSQLQPGQIIRLHFAPAGGLASFNAQAEIVNKKFESRISSRYSPVAYAVRFLEVDAKVGRQLAEHFARSK